MFSNCIKYNNDKSSTNIYRIEAIRQRKLFSKLYEKATIEFEMSMGYTEQNNSSSVKSVKKATKSNKAKASLSSLGAMIKACHSSAKKRKRIGIHSTQTKLSRKRIDTGPRCQSLGTVGKIKASPTSPMTIGCDFVTRMVLGRSKVSKVAT
jgi:hypothetical protein